MVRKTHEQTAIDRKYSPFDFLSPVDSRYYGTEADFYEALHPYLSEEANIRYQLKVEQELIAQLEASGIAPKGISEATARAVVEITPTEVYAEEQKIHHNVRAIANCIRSRLDDASRGYVHLFATSNDITDTARAVALRDVTRDIILEDLHALMGVLVETASEYADVPQIGRTHGRHAVPITLGYWLANYIDRLGQRTEFLVRAAENLRGKMSGAVGAHNSFGLKWPGDPAFFEKAVLARLGLQPSDYSVSTQIVQPEYLADFAHALVSSFSVLANLADDYRQLMRSEIEEVVEDTSRYVGSSTMPHKVNPKNFENVKSLWKTFMPRMTTFYLDQISEHQRDLTNSASGRFVNELVAGFDYAIRRLRKAIQGTKIEEDSLRKCFEMGEGWVVAEPLYIALALGHHADAYEVSKALVKKSKEVGKTLMEYLRTEAEAKEILKGISEEHMEIIMNPAKYTGDASERTRFVCEMWWGAEKSPGRINPIDLLQSKLRGPVGVLAGPLWK
jgi:adenylosuccinate lyase